MKKKALIISYNSLNNSGVPNVIFQTAKAIKDEFEIEIVVFDENNDFYLKKMKENNIKYKIHLIKNKKQKNKLKKIFWNFYGKYQYWKRETRKILSKSSFDVIHSFKEFDSFPFLKEAKKAGIKKRILHCNVIHSHLNTPFSEKIQLYKKQLSLKYSTTKIAVSSLSGNKAFKKDFSILHNSYDEEKYKFSSKNPENFVLGQVGTFSSNKNQIFTIKIFNELLKYNKNFKLKLIGTENESGYLTKMMKLINKFDLCNETTIVDGKNLNLIPYNELTACILPSHFEGAPIVAIEAQACGLTVFASSNVPKEINIGGVEFINIKKGYKYWAKKIIAYSENTTFRREFNTLPYSSSQFKKMILKLYLD